MTTTRQRPGRPDQPVLEVPPIGQFDVGEPDVEPWSSYRGFSEWTVQRMAVSIQACGLAYRAAV